MGQGHLDRALGGGLPALDIAAQDVESAVGFRQSVVLGQDGKGLFGEAVPQEEVPAEDPPAEPEIDALAQVLLWSVTFASLTRG
jgi:hypothetical protein